MDSAMQQLNVKADPNPNRVGMGTSTATGMQRERYKFKKDRTQASIGPVWEEAGGRGEDEFKPVYDGLTDFMSIGSPISALDTPIEEGGTRLIQF
jgi:hypothetical protein